jgi:hypothetical protein
LVVNGIFYGLQGTTQPEGQFLDSYNSMIKDTGVTDIINGGNGEVCYGTTKTTTTMTTIIIISQSWGCYLHLPKYEDSPSTSLWSKKILLYIYRRTRQFSMQPSSEDHKA